MRSVITILLLGMAQIVVQGQDISFKASSDTKEVLNGSAFTVTFTVENGDATRFSPPDFSPFEVISGPSQSYRSTFINGKSSKSIGFSYTLQATREGKFTIAAATIEVAGKTLKSDPISVQVIRQNDQMTQARSGKDSKIFIRAEVDSNQVYIGQQVIIRYKIYTQINIENYNVTKESSYDGCFTQVLDAYREPVTREVIGGEQFSTKVLRKVAVFPQQSGKIDFDPLLVRVGIPNASNQRRSFFSNLNLRTENLTSNAVSLRVKSAYDNAPADFSGAVGNFKVKFRLSGTNATTDDAMTLQLQISGNGDVKTIRPPVIDLPKEFDQYDPKTIDEKMVNATDSVRGVKTIEYLITGKVPNTYVLKPGFTYFDPEKQQYITIRDTFSVTIRQGKGIASAGDNQLNMDPGDKLSPIIFSTNLRTIRKPVLFQTWYWASASLPLLGFMFLFISSRRRRMQGVEEIDHTSLARTRLEKAKTFLDDGNHSAFYEEIAFSIKNYISHKLDISLSDLTKVKVWTLLNDHQLDEVHIEQVKDLLDQCDLALYAHITQPGKMEAVYVQAVQVITVLEEFFNDAE